MALTPWLDDEQTSTRIDDYARQLGSFVDAMADGIIDDRELGAQEQRVVKLMREVEPLLDDATHERVTELLCELSAFNCMQLLHTLYESRPRSTFRG
jgi:hypothetical protein